MTSVAVGFNLNYKPIEEIPTGIPMPRLDMFYNFSFESSESKTLDRNLHTTKKFSNKQDCTKPRNLWLEF